LISSSSVYFAILLPKNASKSASAVSLRPSGVISVAKISSLPVKAYPASSKRFTKAVISEPIAF
jgi:hypothetical protein